MAITSKQNYVSSSFIFIFLLALLYYTLLYDKINNIFIYISTLNILLILIDIYISLKHFIVGFIVALIVGIPIGIILGCFDSFSKFIGPIIDIIRPIPPLSWVPFAIIWMKLTNNAASFIIFIGVVFPIIIGVQNSIQKVPSIYIETGKILGCIKKHYQIFYIIIPYIKPYLYSSIKVSSGVGWMCLVASEMFGINGLGLGYKISYYYNLQRIDIVIIYMILLGILGLFIDEILKIIFKKTISFG